MFKKVIIVFDVSAIYLYPKPRPPAENTGKNQYVAAVFSALISFFFLFHKYLFTLLTYAYNQMLS